MLRQQRRTAMRRVILFGLLAVFAFAALGQAPVAAAPHKIKLGGSPFVPSVLYTIFYEKPINLSLMRHYGKSYTVDMQKMSRTPVLVQALAAKEIAIGFVAPISFANAIVNAKLDLKIVADTVQEGVGGHNAIRFGVLEGSSIRNAADLKGKIANVFAFGTAVDLAFRAMMAKVKLSPTRDLQLVQGSFPAQEAMLREKKVHLASFVPPFSMMVARKGGIRFLFTASDALGKFQSLFLVARSDELKKHRDAYNDFFEDFVRAWKWSIDPANKQAIIKASARITKFPEKSFAWFGTEFDFHRDAGARPNLKALQKNIDLGYELKFAKGRFDIGPYVDLSFVDRANRILSK